MPRPRKPVPGAIRESSNKAVTSKYEIDERGILYQ